MRIAIISPKLGDAFGQERVVMDSVGALRALGHEAILIGESDVGIQSNPALGRVESYLIPHLFSLHYLTQPFKLHQVMRRLNRLLAQLKPELIHWVDQPHHQILKWSVKHFPSLLTAHTVAPSCPASHRLLNDNHPCQFQSGWGCIRINRRGHCLNFLKSDLRRLHAIRAYKLKKQQTFRLGKVLAISEYVKQTLIKDGYPASQIELVYNPVELPTSVSALEQKPNHLIVSACRLVPLKGIEHAIHALKEIEALNWNYWILGTGPLENSLKQLVSKLGLSERIRFLGRTSRDETLQIMSSADIFLQTNVGPEGFGLALAEAAGLGRACIAFDVPALNEIILHEKTGLLISPKDTGALSNAIEELLCSPTLRMRLGAAAKSRIQKEFSLSTHTTKTLDIYQSLTR